MGHQSNPHNITVNGFGSKDSNEAVRTYANRQHRARLAQNASTGHPPPAVNLSFNSLLTKLFLYAERFANITPPLAIENGNGQCLLVRNR
jgi:hypothetical protein